MITVLPPELKDLNVCFSVSEIDSGLEIKGKISAAGKVHESQDLLSYQELKTSKVPLFLYESRLSRLTQGLFDSFMVGVDK